MLLIHTSLSNMLYGKIDPINFQDEIVISGTVTDITDTPHPGVNVQVKGSDTGISTDFDGNYEIEAPEDATLIFSSLGFEDQEVEVNGRETMDIALYSSSSELDEVVVVGYGTEKKINLTGSVSSIKGDDMTKRPVTNPTTMLEGQVPGLRVVQGSGQPGAEDAQIQIRGQGTYSDAGSNPLVLIDGVEGDLNSLNPDDIEDISVLKDAASASIYGSKAANGVILVTTKNGKEGEFSIEYTGTFSRHSPTKMLDLVTNSADYMRLFNEAKENSGVASSSNTYSDEMIDMYENATDREQFPNFDWLDYMFEPVFVQQHNLALSGGNKKTTYRVTLGYVDQPGVMKGFDYQKLNMRSNLQSEIKDWATIGVNLGLKKGDTKQPRQGQQDAFYLRSLKRRHMGHFYPMVVRPLQVKPMILRLTIKICPLS